MSIEPYSDTVRALFDDPRHAGAIDGATRVRNADQGVVVELYAEASADRIGRLRFLAWGCPHLIAAAESFCADFEGRSPADLNAFAARDLLRSLPVPVEKTGRILVIEDAVHSLRRALRKASETTMEGKENGDIVD